MNYPYKIELHAHTAPASPCGKMSPAELVRRYAEKGYDGIVITNHFIRDLFPESYSREEAVEYYLSDYRLAREAGAQLGVNVMLGTEIRFPESCNDYLVYGIGEDDLLEIFDLLSGDITHFSEVFRRPDRLLIWAHPCRNGIVPVDPALFDGVEVFNLHPGHNSRVALAAAIAEKAGGLVTGGSDCHEPGREGMIALRARELPTDSFALARLLREKDYAFSVGSSLILPYGAIER